jgi:hypothetical protein
MNLLIEIPYCYDIHNKKEDLIINNKILDYLVILVKINYEIGEYMDILDRLYLFDTTINLNNIESKIIKLEKIIKKIKKNNINKKDKYIIIFEKLMKSHYYIIDYKIKYNMLMKSKH